MKSTVSSHLRLCALLAVVALSSTVAAQGWPARSVRLVVPAPVGSSLDIVGRIVGDRLAQEWRQPVLVEARPGAGGLLGVQAAAQGSDGHTVLLAGAAASIIAPLSFKTPKIDFAADWLPTATLGVSPLAFVTGTHGKTDTTLAGMLRAAKAQPGKVSIGNPLSGTTPHLTAEMLGTVSGAKFYHVFAGNIGQALGLVVGGDLDYYVDSVTTLLPMLREGRLKVVAVTSPEVYPGLEGMPLAKDTLPEMVAMSWFALFMPAGTPSDVVNKINADVRKVLASPEVLARLRDAGTYALPGNVAETAEFVRKERALWTGVIRQIGLKPQ